MDESRTRQERTRVDGLLLLNKPAGMTSNQALQKIKHLLRARKAGHTGSLDPAATGMLPLCFGEATKVCAFLLEADKTYRVTVRLGTATDTGDADGESIETADVPDFDRAGWERVLRSFLGWTEQVPPMYSALKQDGKRLYELARQGHVVERKPRPVRVDSIELLEYRGNRLVFRVRCSKGTYVRTLVEDIARAAGTVAHTAGLHRESVGHFRAEDMLDLRGAEEVAAAGADALRKRLLPADSALSDLPARHIALAQARRFVGGERVGTMAENEAPGDGQTVRVYAEDERFLGVGELTGDGWIQPRRIFLPADRALAGPGKD